MKKTLFLILTIFTLISAFSVCSVSVSADSYYDEESGKTIIDTNWWFEEISVVMDVRRDKTVHVTETMKVGFLKGGQNTGIIRDIQRVSQTTRIIDGKEKRGKNFLTTLSDVEVTINGEPAKVTRSYYGQGQFHSVKMQKQDGSYFPATDQSDKNSCNTFVLSYVYGVGDDKVSGYDDLTIDLLGYAMDYTKRFSATVTFPSVLDESAVSFRTNGKAAWEPSEGETKRIDGNTVMMSARPMKEHKGYTLQALFDDGYFETQRTFFWYYIPFAVLAAAALGAGIILFLKYRGRKPIAQVEFYPPEGMNVMRYSAIWHGRARRQDLGAVITSWASKGCVRIEKDGANDFTVYKLQDLPEVVRKENEETLQSYRQVVDMLEKTGSGALLDAVNETYEELTTGKSEREYFDELFQPMFGGFGENSYFSTREMKRSSDPHKKRKLSQKAEKMRMMGETPSVLYPNLMRGHILLTIASLVPFLMTIIYYCILSMSAIPIFFFIFIAAGTGVGSFQAKERMTPIAYVFPIAFTALPFFALSSIFYLPLYDYAGLLYLSLAIWALAQVALHFLTRRDPDVMHDYGKMRGFKQFLLTAELNRIKLLFDENPDYFSDIIPYCLVMGISKQVEKRFKPLNIAAPEWACGISPSAFSSMSRSLSSSSGGSSGGGGGHGGSPGGGSGGGGSRGC